MSLCQVYVGDTPQVSLNPFKVKHQPVAYKSSHANVVNHHTWKRPKLRALSDLFMKLQFVKEDGYLLALSYLDIADDIEPIV